MIARLIFTWSSYSTWHQDIYDRRWPERVRFPANVASHGANPSRAQPEYAWIVTYHWKEDLGIESLAFLRLEKDRPTDRGSNSKDLPTEKGITMRAVNDAATEPLMVPVNLTSAPKNVKASWLWIAEMFWTCCRGSMCPFSYCSIWWRFALSETMWNIEVWDDLVPAVDQGDAAAQWICNVLQKPKLRLVAWRYGILGFDLTLKTQSGEQTWLAIHVCKQKWLFMVWWYVRWGLPALPRELPIQSMERARLPSQMVSLCWLALQLPSGKSVGRSLGRSCRAKTKQRLILIFMSLQFSLVPHRLTNPLLFAGFKALKIKDIEGIQNFIKLHTFVRDAALT